MIEIEIESTGDGVAGDHPATGLLRRHDDERAGIAGNDDRSPRCPCLQMFERDDETRRGRAFELNVRNAEKGRERALQIIGTRESKEVAEPGRQSSGWRQFMNHHRDLHPRPATE